MREASCLWNSIARSGAKPGMSFHGRGASVAVGELAAGSTFGTALDSLRGRSVLIATHEQLPTALALVELDGVARRMVLCTPDLAAEQLAAVAATAQADAIVLEAPRAASAQGSSALDSLAPYVVTPQPVPGPIKRGASVATEWILLTSGT